MVFVIATFVYDDWIVARCGNVVCGVTKLFPGISNDCCTLCSIKCKRVILD